MDQNMQKHTMKGRQDEKCVFIISLRETIRIHIKSERKWICNNIKRNMSKGSTIKLLQIPRRLFIHLYTYMYLSEFILTQFTITIT